MSSLINPKRTPTGSFFYFIDKKKWNELRCKKYKIRIFTKRVKQKGDDDYVNNQNNS